MRKKHRKFLVFLVCLRLGNPEGHVDNRIAPQCNIKIRKIHHTYTNVLQYNNVKCNSL